MQKKPLLSICIPTFKRINELNFLVENILSEGLNDCIEVLVGNDDPDYLITKNDFNSFSENIIIYNNNKNLGEFDNMNNLLEKSNGIYVTWIFDDDSYRINFLKIITEELKKNYDVIFSGFSNNRKISKIVNVDIYTNYLKFLRDYHSKKIKILGCCGFYKRNILENNFKFLKLVQNKIAIHVEYNLIYSLAAARKIKYIDIEGILVNVDKNSWSVSNNELEEYVNSSLELIDRASSNIDDSLTINDIIQKFISINFEKSKILSNKSYQESMFIENINKILIKNKHDIFRKNYKFYFIKLKSLIKVIIKKYAY